MKFLVKGTNWLGDAVMSLPTLRTLRRMHPKAHIAVLTRASLAGLYSTAPEVDETIPYTGWLEVVRSLKKRAFDTAIILPRSFSSAFMIFSARIPRRIGFRGGARSAMLTDAVDRDPAVLKIHRVHYYHKLLESLGKPPTAEAPTIQVPAGALDWADAHLPKKRPLIAINPGATYGEAKQWFPERFIEVGRKLRAAVVTVGGPAEAALGERVAKEIGNGAFSLSGRTDIPQLAAVLKRSSLLLTNDTGPMHVADAVGTPIVAVFGPTDTVTTPPYGKNHVIVRKEMDCSPCLKRKCPLGHHNCMKLIAPDEVAAACGRFL